MKLELTHQEHALLLDSIFARLRQIDRLIDGFEDQKLIDIYSNDKTLLLELQNKLENQYETEAV
jgi:hypothetical protein